MRRLGWLPLLLLALISSVWPQNDERILDYHSDITVSQDGSMVVRETIKVRSRGQQIKRGIYRDFPTTYQDRSNQLQRVTFQLLEVLRDGRPEGSRVVGQGNGVRIYVGKPEVFLSPGEYTYTIAYRTTNQLSSFEDHDELYWNVTGNGWDFFIDQASATVTLPKAVPRRKLQLEGYTGPQGAKGQNLLSKVGPDGKSTFQTTKVLAPREGLTIVVSFPKGIVTPPKPAPAPPPAAIPSAVPARQATPSPASPPPASTPTFQAGQGELIALVGLMVVFLYYLLIWWQVGRDPKGGAIMPIYEPPRNFSPAGIRYLTQMGFDDQTFAAAVLNLAVKGHLDIHENAGRYTLSKKAEGGATLSQDETAAFSSLFVSTNQLDLIQANHSIIDRALEALENSLKKSQQKVYFFNNSLYLIPGVLLTLAALVAVWIAMNLSSAYLGVAVVLTIIFMACVGNAFQHGHLAQQSWKQVFSGEGSRSLGAAISSSVVALLYGFGIVLGLLLFIGATSPTIAGLLAAAVGCNVLFYYLLKSPTYFGRKMLDQIEGFKMFLSAVEGDRLHAGCRQQDAGTV